MKWGIVMKTVKVFISSTFKDMNAERDVLIRNVFPRLKEWAEEKLKVMVQEVDLRWGVTEEQAARGMVQDICLEGIDECKPYFLCLMGKRYGWIPAPNHISREIFEKITSPQSILEEDEIELVRLAYSGSHNERVRSLDIKINPENRDFFKKALKNAGMVPSDDRENIENIKALVQSTLEKAGVEEASMSITEKEIRHVLEDYEIPKVISNLGKAIKDRELCEGDRGLLDYFYKREGSEPIWYLQPGCTDDEKRKLSSILCSMGLRKGFYSFFMFRKDIGEDHPDYVEKYGPQVRKLKGLREFIIKRKDINSSEAGTQSPAAIEEYPCAWKAGASEGEHFVTNLDEFEDMVFRMLKGHMSNNKELLADETAVMDEQSVEHGLQMHFVDMRTYGFRGRAKILKGLEKSIDDALEGSLRDSTNKALRYIMVSGEPGSGKSSLLAKLYLNLIEHEKARPSGTLIISRFIGASPRSTSSMHLIRDFCAILIRECKISEGSSEGEKDASIPSNPIELKKAFADFLKKAGRRVVIIVDALNQLQKGTGNNLVSWLPKDLPGNACIVMSIAEGGSFVEDSKNIREAMKERGLIPQEIYVEKLSQEEKKDIVTSYLKQYNKELSQSQVDRIINKRESYNPLYLQVALEELRMVSRFEEVDGFTESGIRETAHEMFEKVLERIENDMERQYGDKGRELFKRYMINISLGRSGMSEQDLRLLLGDWRAVDKNAKMEEKRRQAEKIRLSDYQWSSLKRSMRMYMFLSGDLWNFFHQQLKQAVGTRYLKSEADRYEARMEIVGYLEVMGYEHVTTAKDLPHHLSKAGKIERLKDLLLTFKWMYEKLHAADVHELISDYNLLDDKDIRLVKDALVKSSHILGGDKDQLPSQVYGRLMSYSGGQNIGRFLKEIEAWEESPWLRPLKISLIQAGGPIIRTMEGHSGGINGLCIMPDGRKAVSASNDKTIKVWDIEAGEELRTLTGHSESVNRVCITPDGRMMVSATQDKTLKVWDMETGEELRTLTGHDKSVYGVCITPDGKKAVSASGDNTCKVWDIETGRELKSIKPDGCYVYDVCIIPGGKYAVSALADRTLYVWDIESGEEIKILKGHYDGIKGVCITADGKKVVSASDDMTLKVWDIETGSEIRRKSTYSGLACSWFYKHTNGVTGVAVTTDGKKAVSSSWDKTLKVWDMETGEEIKTLTGHSDGVMGVCITPDGKKAVSASNDGTLKVWDLENTEEPKELAGHSNFVSDLMITPDGRKVITASHDKTLKVWDIDTCRETASFEMHDDGIDRFSITPDGKRVISASFDNTVRLWDMESGREVSLLEEYYQGTVPVAVTPDGKKAASAVDYRTVKVIDIETGSVRKTPTGHSRRIEDLKITPDGRRAVTASLDKTLKVWDLEKAEEICMLTGHSGGVVSVAITPDNNELISISEDKALKVWDIIAGREIRTLKFQNSTYLDTFITSNIKEAISVTEDGAFKVWNLKTGSEIKTLAYDISRIHYSCTTPMGRKMVSESKDGTIKVWDMEELKETATLSAGRKDTYCMKITPDGLKAVSLSEDKTLNVWDMENGNKVCSFASDGGINSSIQVLDSGMVIAGDNSGPVHFLKLQGI